LRRRRWEEGEWRGGREEGGDSVEEEEGKGEGRVGLENPNLTTGKTDFSSLLLSPPPPPFSPVFPSSSVVYVMGCDD